MADLTTNLGASKPAVNDPVDANIWGTQQNAAFDIFDAEHGTKTINQNFADFELQRALMVDYAIKTVAANSGSSYDIDLESGNHFVITLTDNCTFTFSNPPATDELGGFTLHLKQDGTGSRTTTWPASVDWAGGSAPTLSTAASSRDRLSFVTDDGGIIWDGSLIGRGFA